MPPEMHEPRDRPVPRGLVHLLILVLLSLLPACEVGPGKGETPPSRNRLPWTTAPLSLDFLRGWVSALALVPGEGHVLAAGADDRWCLWDLDPEFPGGLYPSADMIGHGRAGQDGITALAVHPGGRIWASGGFDGEIVIRDFPNARPLRKLEGHEENITSLAFSPDGEYLASGSGDDTLRLWEVETGDELDQWEVDNDYDVTAVAFDPAGEVLASGDGEGRITLRDPETGDELQRLQAHSTTVTAVEFSPDGRWLLTAGRDGRTRLWNARDGSPGIELEIFEGDITDAVFRPDGRRLATAGDDGTVRIFEVDGGRRLFSIPASPEAVTAILFEARGEGIVVGSRDSLYFWSPEALEASGSPSTGISSK